MWSELTCHGINSISLKLVTYFFDKPNASAPLPFFEYLQQLELNLHEGTYEAWRASVSELRTETIIIICSSSSSQKWTI